jgi:hypothetical protein
MTNNFLSLLKQLLPNGVRPGYESDIGVTVFRLILPKGNKLGLQNWSEREGDPINTETAPVYQKLSPSVKNSAVIPKNINLAVSSN